MSSRVAALCCLVVAGSAVWSEPMMLAGVPRTGWDRPYTAVQMLQAGLAGLGCERTYDELMVASGAAFRMAWRDGNYNFPAVLLYQQDPVLTGALAVGGRAVRRQYNDAEAAFGAVVESIDKGAPVIAWDNGSCSMQVIVGYDAADKSIFRRTIETAQEPEQGPADRAKAMTFARVPFELWLLSYGAEQPLALDWPVILANALRLSQWPNEERLYGCFVCGEAAYLAWARDLRDPVLHSDFRQAGEVCWRQAWQMGHARGLAGRVLQGNAAVHPCVFEAGLLYQDEAAIFRQIQQTLCGGVEAEFAEAGRLANEEIAKEEVRMAAAELVEKALAKDRAARAAVAKALEELRPELLPEGAGE